MTAAAAAIAVASAGPSSGRRDAGVAHGSRATCRRSSCSSAASSLWEVVVGGLDLRAFLLPAAVRDRDGAGRQLVADASPAAVVAGDARSRRSAAWSSAPSRASLVAFAAARWATRPRRRCCPLAIAASAIPIIAFAPLMNNWFGVLNPLSKMMMAARARVLPGHGQRDPRPGRRSSRPRWS